jgi:hypothetical protein
MQRVVSFRESMALVAYLTPTRRLSFLTVRSVCFCIRFSQHLRAADFSESTDSFDRAKCYCRDVVIVDLLLKLHAAGVAFNCTIPAAQC